MKNEIETIKEWKNKKANIKNKLINKSEKS